MSAYLSVCLLLCVCLCVWYVCTGWSEDLGWPSLSFTFFESVLYFCHHVCQGSWFLSCWGFSCLHFPPPQKCWDWRHIFFTVSRHILLYPDTFYCVQTHFILYPGYMKVLGIQTPVLTVEKQVLCPLSHLLRPHLSINLKHNKTLWPKDILSPHLDRDLIIQFYRHLCTDETLPVSDYQNGLYKVHKQRLPLSPQCHFRYLHQKGHY